MPTYWPHQPRVKIEWASDGDGGKIGRIAERFRPRTWPFGGIHQCVVDIDGTDARICLPAQHAQRAAMKRAVEWVHEYRKTGPKSVEQTLREEFEHWPTLFRTRLDVIDQVFFVSGNGYAWLDGAIINGDQDAPYIPRVPDPETAAFVEQMYARVEKQKATAKKIKDPQARKVFEESIDAQEAALVQRDPRPPAPGPEPDDGKPKTFFPVDNYSLIRHVPDDARSDWLVFAYEAAQALRDRHVPENGHPDKNVAHAKKIIADLERRFPRLNT